MNKYFKTSILLIVLIITISSLVHQVAAQSIESDCIKVNIHGYEISVSQDLSNASLSKISSKCAKYIAEKKFGTLVSIKTTVSQMDETNLSENSISMNEENASLSSIPSSALYENVMCFRAAGSPASGYDEFDFVYYGELQGSFMVKMTDVAGLAWSDDFTIVKTECDALYWEPINAKYYNKGDDNLFVNRISIEPEAGVGYSLKLKYNSYSLDNFAIVARVKKLNSSGTANIIGKYAHKTFGIGGISIGVTSAPSVSFTPSFTVVYDSSQGDVAFLYY